MTRPVDEWATALRHHDGFGPEQSQAPSGLSATRKLTARNEALLAAGRHPATGRPLLDNDSKCCGNCAHHHAYRHHNRVYHKCECHRLGESHSAASDVRVGWPACTLHREVQVVDVDTNGRT